MRWKTSEKKEGKKRMMSEGVEEGSVAPLELSDEVMEQVEAMAKELRKISGRIKALIEGVGRLTEAVVGLGRKEVEKKNKEIEMEDVWRVDRQIEMEKEVEDSEEDKGSEEEEEKGDNGKENEGGSDRTEDGEEGEQK
jgi:hypothetical protein